MITILSPDEQLKYLPIQPQISEELRRRENDKLRMINRVPFLRVSCLQKVTYSDEDFGRNKQSNLSEVRERVGVSDTSNTSVSSVDGFIFELNSSFDESYGQRQVIGTELSSLKQIYIKNPRRVPPPRLESFTATVGEEAGFYTTGTLKFTVNSKEQLEFLTPFLLHPGNTVMFEFGYSDENNNSKIDFFNNSDIDEFLTDITYDPKSKQVQTSNNSENANGFFKKLQKKVIDSSGNYEFLVGVINNFDFTLNENFGFDVTVDVWSISKTILSSKNGTPIETTNVSSSIRASKEILIRNRVSNIRAFIDRLENPSSRAEKDDVITLSTSRGYSKYITLKKILEILNSYNTEIKYKVDQNVKSNKYLVSSDNTCIIFKKNFPTLKNLKINTENGDITFKKDDIQLLGSYKRIIGIDSIKFIYSDQIISTDTTSTPSQPPLSDTDFYNIERQRQIENLERTGGADEVSRLETQTTVKTVSDVIVPEDKIYVPYIFDENDSETGNLNYIYYDVEQFLGHYMNYDGKPNDVLKQIIEDINYCTRNYWDLKLFEIFDLLDNETPQTQQLFSFSSRNIEQKDRTNTHTFKFNQEESVVTLMTFDLGLEGLIADQIYFESLNQTDSSVEGSKLNVLLFEKHENKIQIEDKRTVRLKQLYEKIKTTGNTTTPTIDDVEVNTTGSFESFYESDPSTYLLSIADKGQSRLQPRLFDLIRGQRLLESEITLKYNSIKKDTDSFLMPLIEPNYQVYQMAMKEDGYIQSQNETSGGDDEEQQEKKLGGISPLLESRLTMSLPGVGGLQPLQFFNTEGLPDVYDKRGDFCIMSVTQTISPNDWTTSLSAAFRVRRKDE